MNPDPLPSALTPLPEDLNKKLEPLGSLWAKHSVRPRLDADIARCWHDLIKTWSVDPSLPLSIRKREKGVARGEVILHESGRELVLTDTSPASGSYMLAFAKA